LLLEVEPGAEALAGAGEDDDADVAVALRIPNSRVRPLTENASTPATPTIEIASATAAKPPKTIALRRSGRSSVIVAMKSEASYVRSR